MKTKRTTRGAAESMGARGAKIEMKARELGYVAFVSSHWMTWGDVAIHCRDAMTVEERVALAGTFPNFQWTSLEKISTGGHTIHGKVTW